MRLAIVVQRYGLDVNGGSELHARQVAEHIAPYVQVEVLTTCARDYMTWANHYTPGCEIVNNILVRRFPVQAPRDVAAFNAFSAEIVSRPRTYFDEVRWMALQGPDAPELFRFIQAEHERYDLFLFFTYLYATTFIGLQLVPQKSIMCPTAHDEPWLYFDIYRSLFHLPRAFIFNTPEEEAMLRHVFHNQAVAGEIIGVGIEAPEVVAPPQAEWGDPYIMYLGRIDESKGCGELLDYFLRYKAETQDPVRLVLIGTQVMPVPKHRDIVTLGFVSDEERFQWLSGAQVFVMPSPFESLSMATLEAWILGVPAIVNARCEVLKGHCQRSKAGLYYHTAGEFSAALSILRANAGLRHELGERGRAYVQQHYNWQAVTGQYVSLFRRVYATIAH